MHIDAGPRTPSSENGPEHFARWRSGRHREHELVDQLRWLSALGGGKGCLSVDIIDIEVPVVQERLSDSAAKALTVIGFPREGPKGRVSPGVAASSTSTRGAARFWSNGVRPSVNRLGCRHGLRDGARPSGFQV